MEGYRCLPGLRPLDLPAWEKKLGLPAHRIEGASRSSVFAYKDELDQWILERSKATGDHPARAPQGEAAGRKRRLSRRARLVLFHMAEVAAIGIGFFIMGRSSYSSRPHNFKIDEFLLTILGGKGRELWKFDTELKNLLEDAEYRKHFQVKRRDPADEFHEGDLFCFNDRGRELWHFKAGRELKFGNKVFLEFPKSRMPASG